MSGRRRRLGLAERAGSVSKVPAAEIETLVVKSVREKRRLAATMHDRTVVADHLTRVNVQPERLIIHLVQNPMFDEQRNGGETLQVPW